MIAKIILGNSFEGAVRYVFSKERARYLCGTFGGKTPGEILMEGRVFLEVMETFPWQKNTVFHESISILPGEVLSEESWRQVAEDHMEYMGFGRSPWVAVRHNDRPHPHMHVVALRMTEEYKVVENVFKSAERAAWHLMKMSLRYGVSAVKTNRIKFLEEHGVTVENSETPEIRI